MQIQVKSMKSPLYAPGIPRKVPTTWAKGLLVVLCFLNQGN